MSYFPQLPTNVVNHIFEYADIYNKFQMFINHNIKIKLDDNKIIEGQFIGINDDGSLILFHNNKELSIYSGQILL